MDSLFSSTLDRVALLRLRKIKEKNPTFEWYNEHTRNLKRAAQKMERSRRKTKLKSKSIVEFPVKLFCKDCIIKSAIQIIFTFKSHLVLFK